jgi:hypothetical protein
MWYAAKGWYGYSELYEGAITEPFPLLVLLPWHLPVAIYKPPICTYFMAEQVFV